MFKITDLTKKDIINVKDGAKLGPVKDVHINSADGKVVAIVLDGPRRFLGLMSAGKDNVVPWEKIKLVGKHAVLVEVD
ncbi:sporulation protein, YlmC/YmxH family [Desulfotomaculum arcticum]|uniref:Sporulation protein, YlmC/YmxH family n=1 Tax=Desulfotruncus arcticus DSM 17038 TaxID=1121424 RepID=A0A1I2T9L1_9FIRM|nr:YlmC/YmxH family sporulation protein [Desulfotruncus arcticus]SFG61714.1 sporulation protein, YlmC/YmxH family [Desulfotomaculum arcticum] [Desulfotruncus arcticus DSM 17038]